MPTDLTEPTPRTVMLVCGEPSGDQLGAELMARLKSVDTDIRIVGVGGAAMAAQGLNSLFPLDDTAVMGLREVVPRIPAILRRVREASGYALAVKPDALVLIDSPDFTHRIAQRVKRLDPSIRTVNYVAPQVWASRQYRARKMARYFDLVLALLPFEVPFFHRYGLRAEFVGHPVIERVSRMVGGDALRSRLGISPNARILVLLPGSRMNEVRLLLPRFREAAAIIARAISDVVCLLPTVPHVQDFVRENTRDWPLALHILEGEPDKFAAFKAADVALAASGTVTTELALARTPMVAAYRLGWLTYTLARPFISVRFVTLVNLLLERGAVPELIQRACTGPALASAVLDFLGNGDLRERQREALDEATKKLGIGGAAPSQRAADALLAFIWEPNR